MNKIETDVGWLKALNQFIYFNENNKVIIYKKSDLVFLFKFHHIKSGYHNRVGTR